MLGMWMSTLFNGSGYLGPLAASDYLATKGQKSNLPVCTKNANSEAWLSVCNVYS